MKANTESSFFLKTLIDSQSILTLLLTILSEVIVLCLKNHLKFQASKESDWENELCQAIIVVFSKWKMELFVKDMEDQWLLQMGKLEDSQRRRNLEDLFRLNQLMSVETQNHQSQSKKKRKRTMILFQQDLRTLRFKIQLTKNRIL